MIDGINPALIHIFTSREGLIKPRSCLRKPVSLNNCYFWPMATVFQSYRFRAEAHIFICKLILLCHALYCADVVATKLVKN